jgi:hypothetical protein
MGEGTGESQSMRDRGQVRNGGQGPSQGMGDRDKSGMGTEAKSGMTK